MKDANLKGLFESDLLSEEAKTVLQEAWNTALQHKEAELEVAYAEKLEESQKDVQENIFKMIEEAVADELASVADEITEARNLEVKYAQKLSEFKGQYDEKIQEQVQSTIDQVVKEELDELKEDIEMAKKHQFALDMFESYKAMYAQTFGGDNLNAQDELAEAKQELETLKREKTLNGLLESVTGNKRQVALTILEGVSTDKLEERFESIRPILLAESEESDDAPLTEGKEVEGKVVLEGAEEEDKPTITESKVDDAVLKRLQRSIKMARG